MKRFKTGLYFKLMSSKEGKDRRVAEGCEKYVAAILNSLTRTTNYYYPHATGSIFSTVTHDSVCHCPYHARFFSSSPQHCPIPSSVKMSNSKTKLFGHFLRDPLSPEHALLSFRGKLPELTGLNLGLLKFMITFERFGPLLPTLQTVCIYVHTSPLWNSTQLNSLICASILNY